MEAFLITGFLSFSVGAAGALILSRLLKHDDSSFKEREHEIRKTESANLEDRLEHSEKARGQLQRSIRRTIALNRLLRKFNEDLNIERIAGEMAEFLVEQFGIRYYVLFRREVEGGFTFFHSNAEEPYLSVLKQTSIPAGETSLHEAVCRRRKRLYWRDVPRKSLSSAEHGVQQAIPIRTLLVFPLVSADQVMGTLDLSHPSETIDLTPEDLTDLEVFVEHLAVTLRNSLLVGALEDQGLQLLAINQRLETEGMQIASLNQLLRNMNEALDLDLVLNLMLDYVKSSFDIHYYVVYLIDQANGVLTYHRSNIESFLPGQAMQEFTERKLPLFPVNGIHALACERKRYIYLPMIRGRSDSELENANLELTGMKSLLIFPLVTGNRIIGVLDFSMMHDRMRLSRADLARLSIFSEQFAVVLNNSLLIEELERQQLALERSVYEIETTRNQIEQLNEFTRKMNEQTDFKFIASEIFRYLEENFGLEFSWLMLVNREKQTLFTSMYSRPLGLTPAMLSFLDSFEIPLEKASGTLYRTAFKRKPYYLPRIPEGFQGSPVDEAIKNSLNLKWFLHVPLVIRGETAGILAFTNLDRMLHLKSRDVHRIQSFADQIAGALNNAFLHNQVQQEKTRADELLRNILPVSVADELQDTGQVITRVHDDTTIVFADFAGFTAVARGMSAEDLIRELDGYFYQFDEIIRHNRLTKLKTIGDSYMFAGGLPEARRSHAIDACLAALEIQAFMHQQRDVKASLGIPFWELRIGINTGPVAAGVIGKDRFTYDVWGDTVNVSSRMESDGEPGRINISAATYNLVKYFFECEYRGFRPVKNHGEMEMYFLNRIHPKLSVQGMGHLPNDRFMDLYRTVLRGKRIAYRSEIEKKTAPA
ncbi:MAG: GAF domain-containing protein [Leptonema illini]|uniref:GAF domain-containing protein n=1 Tax=Leptonema illini TaxID=183 RepID=A0A833H4D5_9LEPT|nr:MAG: GAF domain-containing protein [Leptonema illini]PKL30644.1 MAG: hypothetical protein CVV45_16470 [Spirochaetae bacterium HGW-Spirochaetae-10]